MFFHVFPIIAFADNDASGAWPVWTPGARLAGLLKMSTIHCHKQHMKALVLVFSEKFFFFFFFFFFFMFFPL